MYEKYITSMQIKEFPRGKGSDGTVLPLELVYSINAVFGQLQPRVSTNTRYSRKTFVRIRKEKDRIFEYIHVNIRSFFSNIFANTATKTEILRGRVLLMEAATTQFYARLFYMNRYIFFWNKKVWNGWFCKKKEL